MWDGGLGQLYPIVGSSLVKSMSHRNKNHGMPYVKTNCSQRWIVVRVPELVGGGYV